MPDTEMPSPEVWGELVDDLALLGLIKRYTVLGDPNIRLTTFGRALLKEAGRPKAIPLPETSTGPFARYPHA